MGLAAAVAFRAGFFNIGGEGQLVLGALVAALVPLYLPLPTPLLLPVTILTAALAGGLYALLAAFCQIRFHAPLLITTLLLNYPAKLFASYLATHPLRDVATGMAQTRMIPKGLWFPRLMRGAQLHVGSFLTLAILGLAAFIIYRTVIGYEIRMTGLNARFAQYGGVNINRLCYRVMFASGTIAGMVGAIEVLGVHHRFIDDALTRPLYAWTGLMAALLSGSNPFGVLAAGLFFSAVQTGGFGMERGADVPRELSRVLQALIILLVAARSRFQSEHVRLEE
jgi:simple sugar transport system permease protein